MKEFLRVLPEYDYVYLGDNARTPYGNKSDEVIYNYTRQAVDFLFKQGCAIVILACNTASTKALRKIQQEGKGKVLGVVVPVVEAALELGQGNKLGVIGTTATVGSGVYEKELKKLRADLEIWQQACPMLVPLIEEGWTGKPEAKMILKKYLRPLKNKKIDTLILGCTHYPLMEKEISKVMGKNVKIINSAVVTAEKLKDYLKRHGEIENKLAKNKTIIFYTTDDINKFRQMGGKILGKEIGGVRKAIL